MIKKILLSVTVIAFACAGVALAQQAGSIKRTPLQKAEFPDGYNTVSGSPKFLRDVIPIRVSKWDTCWRAKPTSLSRASRTSI
jgi:hypothetical protein